MRRSLALALAMMALVACRQQPGAETAETAGAPDSAATAAERGRAETGEGARPGAEGDGRATHVVYVPAYSHIYHHEGDAFLLATTLSIRNTDRRDTLLVTSVRYYDTGGRLVRRHLQEPRALAPLGSMEIVVEEQDVSGGSGANFIVEWRSDGPVSRPVVEAVMISTRSGQGVSFTSRGVTIERPGDG